MIPPAVDLHQVDLTTEVVRTGRLVLRPWRRLLDGAVGPGARLRPLPGGGPRAGSLEEGRMRSALPYRDGRFGDAVLHSRPPSDPAPG